MRFPTLLVVLSAAIGCTYHQPRRTAVDSSPAPSVVTSRARLSEAGQAADSHRALVERASIEDHSAFRLGVVEFDDQGALWSRPQWLQVQQDLRDAYAKAPDGAQVFVFIHGWKHSSKVCDSNIACFRELLGSVAHLESPGGRPVYGLYVGWRGESVKLWGLKELSFWGRKATAHRVGGADVIEVLSTLESLHRAQRDKTTATRMTVIGHSFGAAVAHSAVAGVLKERLAGHITRNADPPPILHGFGTLTVLVNPAFEASLYSGLHDMLGQRPKFHSRNPPLLITISSEADTATRFLFPAGRLFSTLMQRSRSWQQRKQLWSTAGNYTGFVTHELEPTPSTPDPVDQDVRCGCPSRLQDFLTAESGRELMSAQAEEYYGGAKLTRINQLPQGESPFIVVKADRRIINGHNDIWSRAFVSFLTTLVGRTDALLFTAQ